MVPDNKDEYLDSHAIDTIELLIRKTVASAVATFVVSLENELSYIIRKYLEAYMEKGYAAQKKLSVMREILIENNSDPHYSSSPSLFHKVTPLLTENKENSQFDSKTTTTYDSSSADPFLNTACLESTDVLTAMQIMADDHPVDASFPKTGLLDLPCNNDASNFSFDNNHRRTSDDNSSKSEASTFLHHLEYSTPFISRRQSLRGQGILSIDRHSPTMNKKSPKKKADEHDVPCSNANVTTTTTAVMSLAAGDQSFNDRSHSNISANLKVITLLSPKPVLLDNHEEDNVPYPSSSSSDLLNRPLVLESQRDAAAVDNNNVTFENQKSIITHKNDVVTTADSKINQANVINKTGNNETTRVRVKRGGWVLRRGTKLKRLAVGLSQHSPSQHSPPVYKDIQKKTNNKLSSTNTREKKNFFNTNEKEALNISLNDQDDDPKNFSTPFILHPSHNNKDNAIKKPNSCSECSQCREFYEILDKDKDIYQKANITNDIISNTSHDVQQQQQQTNVSLRAQSRHKYFRLPSSTPQGYWDIDFPNTQK